MDKRRATLQQAKIFQSQSQQDQMKMLNDLLYNAYNAYWQWAGAYQLFSIYNKYHQISTDRLRLVRIAFDNGDRAVMDTVEAMTQVLNYEAQMTDARQKINTAGLELSNYLWLENDSAYQLPPHFFPDTIQFVMSVNDQSLDVLLNRSTTENPTLKAYTFKVCYPW
jgi:outer membrane protein TolC